MTKLAPEALFIPCNFNELDFQTSSDLAEVESLTGQQRALDALHFGTAIRKPGYNLFVMGPHGMGKHTVVQQHLEQQAAEDQPPQDWCYVNNFAEPHKPWAIGLPAGQGNVFKHDMTELVEDLCTAMPTAFDSDQYRIRIDEITGGVKTQREEALSQLANESEGHNIRLVRTTGGFSFIPLRDKELITPEQYDKLPEEEQTRIEEIVSVLQEKLEHIIRQFHQWQRVAKEKVRELNREVALSAVGLLIEDLRKKYPDNQKIQDYLDAVQQDVIERADDFLKQENQPPATVDDGTFRRYHVNVLVDNDARQGAPVIYEDNPSYDTLIGRVEHIAQMGTLITDFGLIKPGALHRANGGYLILDIVKLLTEPFAWRGLKRVLYAHEVHMQSLGQMLGLVSTVSLEPERIPIDLKVVLLGDRVLFYLLLEHDPEFQELFKVSADFEDSLDRTPENTQLYARLLATIIRREELMPFNRAAMGRVVEFSSRHSQDAQKISSHLLSVTDLMREADFLASRRKAEQVDTADVQQAIDGRIARADRLRDQIYEEIERGVLLIATEGECIGQVNGLSVFDLGNFRFAQPTRITATARLGNGDIIDIEREVELGGAIHSKGVLILSSFLGQRYASDQPLSLYASLVFEQSYGGVEGDSASAGELCALLSVLADAPIRQDFAITGSVNQLGEIQAIGGVNEKIEGFFDICQRKGANNEQGVIIPAANVSHLMLRHDVVEAAEQGRFHIHAVSNIDEAISLLTGIEAGELDDEGQYPADSINGQVFERLTMLSKLRHEHGEEEKEDKD